MALWRCQPLHWNWYYLYLPSKNIQFLKFYCWKSNNSFDHWEDDVYLQDLFLSNWFLLSTFSWGNTMKIPNIFWGFAPNPTNALPWIRWVGSQCPRNPKLIIAIAAQLFTQNSKKNWPANFSLFRTLICQSLFLNKIAALQFYLKRDSCTGVLRWILQNV